MQKWRIYNTRRRETLLLDQSQNSVGASFQGKVKWQICQCACAKWSCSPVRCFFIPSITLRIPLQRKPWKLFSNYRFPSIPLLRKKSFLCKGSILHFAKVATSQHSGLSMVTIQTGIGPRVVWWPLGSCPIHGVIGTAVRLLKRRWNSGTSSAVVEFPTIPLPPHGWIN